MKEYKCPVCGHIVIAQERPAPIRWSDGHTCHFILVPEEPNEKPATQMFD